MSNSIALQKSIENLTSGSITVKGLFRDETYDEEKIKKFQDFLLKNFIDVEDIIKVNRDENEQNRKLNNLIREFNNKGEPVDPITSNLLNYLKKGYYSGGKSKKSNKTKSKKTKKTRKSRKVSGKCK